MKKKNARSKKARPIVCANLFRTGIDTRKRVRRSMTDTTYWYSRKDDLYSIISIAMHWNERVMGRCPTGKLGGRWYILGCWYDKQCLLCWATYLNAVVYQYLSRIWSNGTLKAKWLPDAGKSWYDFTISAWETVSCTSWSWNVLRLRRCPRKYDRNNNKKILANTVFGFSKSQ